MQFLTNAECNTSNGFTSQDVSATNSHNYHDSGNSSDGIAEADLVLLQQLDISNKNDNSSNPDCAEKTSAINENAVSKPDSYHNKISLKPSKPQAPSDLVNHATIARREALQQQFLQRQQTRKSEYLQRIKEQGSNDSTKSRSKGKA
jgi:hypothetical protein